MAASAVVRDALCVMRRPALSRRFSQAVNSSPHPVKVNVGAGAVRLEGWINTDVTWWSEMWLDLTRPWPVGADRISHIYGDNVIDISRCLSLARCFAMRMTGWRRGASSASPHLTRKRLPERISTTPI